MTFFLNWKWLLNSLLKLFQGRFLHRIVYKPKSYAFLAMIVDINFYIGYRIKVARALLAGNDSQLVERIKKRTEDYHAFYSKDPRKYLEEAFVLSETDISTLKNDSLHKTVRKSLEFFPK